MPSIRATVLSNIILDETLLDGEIPWYVPRLIQASGVGSVQAFPSSTVQVVHRAIVRASAPLTVDLTNIQDPIYGAIDLTGARLIAYCIRNDGSVSSTVAPGAAAPYNFSASLTLLPGEVRTVACPTGQPLVSSTSKNIDITPGSGCSVTALLLFGQDAA